MTSRITVNNIESNSGISSIALDSGVTIAEGSGLNVSGIVTATKFVGPATGLSGSPNITVGNITASGTLTYEDVTNVDAIGVITARSGLKVGSGGTVTSIQETSVGIGTTTAAGRDAGIGTATGTLIFAADKGLQCYVGTSGWNTLIDTVTLPTGGTVTTSGGYRIHTYAMGNNNTAAGVFHVPPGGMNRTIDFLLVGGGGGGGQDVAGGGGAGGYVEGSMEIAPGTYKIEVGNGGSKAIQSASAKQGGTTWFYLPNNLNLQALGGGAGEGCNHHSGSTPTDGGSGGGGGANVGSTTQSTKNAQIVGATFVFNGGYNAGATNCNTNGSGGGGAGGAGNQNGDGGAGRASSISGSSVTYAGGGSGANSGNSIANPTGGPGGGGASNGTRAGTDGKGGGGSAGYGGWGSGGDGGDGVVIIRYKV